jgi:hypothetical protein
VRLPVDRQHDCFRQVTGSIRYGPGARCQTRASNCLHCSYRGKPCISRGLHSCGPPAQIDKRRHTIERGRGDCRMTPQPVAGSESRERIRIGYVTDELWPVVLKCKRSLAVNLY